MSSLINLVDKYHSQLALLLIGLAIIILTVIFWVWFYNRKKYHNLKHQIPASVVKSYLDSIIQNSTSLKSSLFRGGGLDVEGGVPSVFPLTDLQSGAQVNLDTGDVKELKAIIDKLQNQLADKNNVIKELENQNADLNNDVRIKQERIIELEGLLKQARSGSDQGAQLAALEEKNKALQEELKQYEMISDDLADLKELKKENAHLRSLLAEKGIDIPEQTDDTPVQVAEAPVEETEPEAAAPAAEEEVAQAVDPYEEQDITQMIQDGVSEAKGEEPAPAVEAAAPLQEADETVAADESSDDSQAEEAEKVEVKSPEDLLEEFEKMLS